MTLINIVGVLGAIVSFTLAFIKIVEYRDSKRSVIVNSLLIFENPRKLNIYISNLRKEHLQLFYMDFVIVRKKRFLPIWSTMGRRTFQGYDDPKKPIRTIEPHGVEVFTIDPDFLFKEMAVNPIDCLPQDRLAVQIYHSKDSKPISYVVPYKLKYFSLPSS